MTSSRPSTETRIRLTAFIALFILGVLITRHYGESWDELQFFKYADRALQSYSTWPRTGDIPLTGNTYDNYGPAYVMLVALGARLLGLVVPWITSDLRHLIYFTTYLVGIAAFEALCRRWLSRLASLGATLLFAAQPLFWGHAFISPKDIPFLAFFLLSLVLGLNMVDRLASFPPPAIDPSSKRRLLLSTFSVLVMMFGLLLATPLVHTWLQGLVTAAASGNANIVSTFASDVRTVSPDVYIRKYFVLFLRAQAILGLASAVGLLFLWRRVPSAIRFVAAVAPAALTLGFTTSIRVLGPFAGLMVAAYALRKSGRRALPTLVTYALIAAAATYVTWPYLWPNPIGHFVESVRVMSEYPWQGQVLFGGAMYTSTTLPTSYLPVLLAIQLTEPVWFLFAGGVAIAAIEAFKFRLARGVTLLTLVAVWFALPALGFILSHAPLYDNFRQVIFILPPVFMMSGLVFEKVGRAPWQAALIVLVILPGIVEGARLHPYEYAYYNRFIGGIQGAFRRYELDYWGTSYREAAQYLQRVAPANGSVWVEGPAHLLGLYARPDLKVYSTYEAARAPHYDFVVALTRFNLDLSSYPDASIVHVIEREGALLTVIKKP